MLDKLVFSMTSIVSHDNLLVQILSIKGFFAKCLELHFMWLQVIGTQLYEHMCIVYDIG